MFVCLFELQLGSACRLWAGYAATLAAGRRPALGMIGSIAGPFLDIVGPRVGAEWNVPPQQQNQSLASASRWNVILTFLSGYTVFGYALYLLVVILSFKGSRR